MWWAGHREAVVHRVRTVGPRYEWGYNMGMKKETLLLVVGLIVFFEPFLGVPTSWKNAISFAAGAVLVSVWLLLRERSRARMDDAPVPGASLYVESRPVRERRAL